jgi:SpoIID/LytB domain protein
VVPRLLHPPLVDRRLAGRDVEAAEARALVRLDAGKKQSQVSPAKVREALGLTKLYSSRFTAETKGKTIHIHGRGFGHGVGMCQWGAKGMADSGKSYGQILAHYYRGVRLKRIY